MKNIHVLPTDKPSYLYKKSDGTLHISDLFEGGNSAWKNQNIYITSDEEIKDGDWMIRDNENPIKVTKDFFWDFGVRYYKIILTTDQDLIKDGVQVIDDEFLEWFVKNPSCEEVEVERDSREVGGHNGAVQIEYGYYEIIITKEDLTKCYCGHTTTCDCGTEEPKQETLEEASLLSRPIHLIWDEGERYDCNEKFREEFKKGAKWQQERMYSEEEVINILMKVYEDIGKRKIPNPVVLAEWFNKFKKK